jgi:tRNA(fMet)-specific endonuclease VapC
VYLLDTNICIFAINKRSGQVLEAIRQHMSAGLLISALTIAELEYGVENSSQIARNRIALLQFTSIFQVLPFDDSAAVHYGKLKSKLKREGQLIGPIDMLLAAQALAHDLTMVTNNGKEFARVEGLRIADWSAA